MAHKSLSALFLGGFLLAACQTTGPSEPVMESVDEPEEVIAETPVTPAPSPVRPEPQRTPARPGPSSASFIGQPASALEAVVGDPDFVRQEMAGEFRRYDLGPCRVYAVISSEGGDRPVIGSLSISTSEAGSGSMTLQECLNAA